MEEFEEDEDVVLEGGAFHKMLQDVGCNDFDPILINRHDSFEKTQHSTKTFERLRKFFAETAALSIFHNREMSYLSGMQIATILKSETLLDDHTEFVQNLMNKYSQSFWNKLEEWTTLIASSVILGISYLLQERKKTLVMLLASSVAAVAVHRKYDEICSISSLKNLVSLQNDLHNLYKKGLRIMSKVCQSRQNSKQALSRFSLEIDRLKFVQPLAETLLKSLASVARICYQSSLIIRKFLPKNSFDDLVTHFEDETFSTDGEIVYDNYKQLYYVYMITQSESMQLLAVAYDADTWMEGGQIPNSLLTRIIFNLRRLVRSHKTQLAQIVEDYESCKPRAIHRTFRVPRASKWRDLYLNLDLLSRKVATAYDTIGSVLEEIDKHADSATSEKDDFIVELKPRISEICKQIDSARNFAEFSDLLLVMLGRSGKREESIIPEESGSFPVIASDLTIVRDSDPQIIDEVFEEYITEEYLKPLYDESDEAGLESAKLDKLLAKNFMSELKEALLDKYKAMSEREAKALSRKRGEIDSNAREKSEPKESQIIPCPPPLPSIAPLDAKPRIVPARREKREFRAPVPLPRFNAKPQSLEDVLNEPVIKQRLSLSAPPPPPEIQLSEENEEKLSIELPILGLRKMPAFVTFEEEFIGNGENSDEEPADNSDNSENDAGPSTCD